MDRKEIKEINKTNRKNDTMKFYKDVRNLTNPSITTLVCKDKDSNILSEKIQILERWQQYFKELLNHVATRINNENIHDGLLNNFGTKGANI
jgi:hypothetical protein